MVRRKLFPSNWGTMEGMTKPQLASLSELLFKLCGPLHKGNYAMLGTVSFYERLRSYNDCGVKDMLRYANLIRQYLRGSSSLMASKYERLYEDLLTVRQRQFAILTLMARGLGNCVPWFPDVYKSVKKAYGSTKHEAVRIVCLMIMGNVTEEQGSLIPVREETGILRVRDLTNTKIGPSDSDQDEHYEGCFHMGKLCIGKRELKMSEMFVDHTRGGEGHLIVNSEGDNDTYTYSWLCNVFKEEVGYAIADVRLSYFNWRDVTGAGHMALAEICAREGYEAVITSDKLELGDVCAEFLNDCIVSRYGECVSESDMIQCYENWYRDICDGREGREGKERHLNHSRVEDLTGITKMIGGHWWWMLTIDACDEDNYTNRLH